jgi:hypothetical protein
MPCRITPSNLSGLIALQLGDIEADVRGRIEEQIDALAARFTQECPSPNELTRIINIQNRLNTSLNQFEARIRPFQRMVNSLQGPLKAAKTLVSVLKAIPIPTTIGVPPPYGGVLFSVPIKITNKYSELLRLACELVVSIEDDIKACNALLSDTIDDLVDVKSQIDLIKPAIEACSQSEGLSSEQLKQIREAAEGENRAGTADTNTDVNYRAANGRDYKLSVLVDPNSPSIAPRRYAVAKDQIGVIILRGPSSFASSTEVLIQELKFRIDNQLP